MDINESRIGKPLTHSVERLRMVVHRREHIQCAQNFHLHQFLVRKNQSRRMRYRTDGNEIANRFTHHWHFVKRLLQIKRWWNDQR